MLALLHAVFAWQAQLGGRGEEAALEAVQGELAEILVSEIRGTSKVRPPIISQNNIWDSERYKLNPTNIFFHNNIWSKRRKDAKAAIRPDIFTAKLAE